MANRGRPLKLTAARRQRIVAAARLGAHREQAALAASISRATLQAWLAKGETEGAPDRFRDFARAVREAEAEAELEALRSIERAAVDGDWRAKCWLLERRWPDRWGRRTRHEVSGPYGEPLELELPAGLGDLAKLSDRELDELGKLMDRTHAR
jgi:hypothetical protein